MKQQPTTDAPLVSVVMPCYHESLEVLSRTIGSILDQTYRNIELVVVIDDPDRPDIIEFLESIAQSDERLRFIPNEANLGVWPSYNRGIRHARGELIAIQDADDQSLPERIEKLVSFLEANPCIDVVGCGLEYIDAETGDSLLVRRYPADVAREIRRRCPMAHATTIRRAGLYEAYGWYDESAEYCHAADYELWCRWLVQGVRMSNIPDCEYVYNQSRTNFKTRNVKAILRDTLRIKREYARRLHFGPFDYLYFVGESVAYQLPAGVVLALFYRIMKPARRHRV